MSKPRVLVVDDEREVGVFFRHLLQEHYEVLVAATGREMQELLRTQRFDLTLLDLKLPDSDGLDLLADLKKRCPACRVVIMTGYGTVQHTLAALRLGAEEYLEKPFAEVEALEKLIHRLAPPVSVTTAEAGLPVGEKGGEEGELFVGQSPLMRQLLARAAAVAPTTLPVLIEGETGSGKEVLARFIHRRSRRPGPFWGVNCAAFSDSLLGSELFGHERGAFTGAGQARCGVLELAGTGTLLLDELGEAGPQLQVLLLRVLETRQFTRLGGEQLRPFAARVLATTNRDIRAAVREGRFRTDLYYRLSAVTLQVPPLRRRREDLPALVEYILRQRLDVPVTGISRPALKLLQEYDWPGNVRELLYVLARAAVHSGGGTIMPGHLQLPWGEPEQSACSYLPSSPAPVSSPAAPAGTVGQVLRRALEQYLDSLSPDQLPDLPAGLQELRQLQEHFARRVVRRALEQCGNCRQQAAERLNLTPRQLRYYLQEK
ncbi:MAG: sigma-54-dependent transcriptional regulator [Desulfurispora sp.]|uniref:sigma-54-dependent transcriptional regulator n=1 Tax=Desulfurispora sp. TaxID=3014275 RepID=UPI00404AEE0E